MITSVNNRDIIETGKLRKKKYRDKTGLFVIEGVKVLKEAINNRIIPEKIYYTSNIIDKIPLISDSTHLIEVSENVLEKISNQQHPEGVLAVFKQNALNFKSNEKKVIILDNIRDPGNLGTIIRTADAAGFDKIYCSDNCADLYNSKTIRGAMGSLFHLPVITNSNIQEQIDILKQSGWSIIGTSLAGENLYLNKVIIPDRFALVFGNESHGLNTNIQESCSKLYRLPIFGKAESLNVAVAAGIFMYAFTDQLI